MNLRYALAYIIPAIAILVFLFAQPITSKIMRTGENTVYMLKDDAARDRCRPEVSVSAIRKEFHELGSGAEIVQDAQSLMQERRTLLRPHQIAPGTKVQVAYWKDYNRLLAQAEASDQAAYFKEYSLHSLRMNDFIFRQKICANDFQPLLKSSAGMELTALEGEMRKSLLSLEEAENKLRESTTFSSSDPAPVRK